ncbi:hypothetical protein D3OALGB2SA_4177 [Olavius algarvensis associated proteobacterium Delta 3]|nr:hypothetical protein D3OALGB2SA_4177 [Olavius algarvensis associated proteobacterium Delta 3]
MPAFGGLGVGGLPAFGGSEVRGQVSGFRIQDPGYWMDVSWGGN